MRGLVAAVPGDRYGLSCMICLSFLHDCIPVGRGRIEIVDRVKEDSRLLE